MVCLYRYAGEKGVPFDPARIPHYSPENAFEDVAGLGTFLMRASVDVVEYHNLGRAGKETVLVKRLGNRPREMVRTIYQDLGLPFELCEGTVSQQVVPAGERLVNTVKNQSLNMAEIRVLTCDEESFALVRHYWKHYLQAKTDAVVLYLNLEDHRCADFAERCEELGFFFCGILPGGVGESEAFILQYLNNIKLDYDRIQIFSSKAQELLTYIRSYNPNDR